jgi:hypothetical protein
MICALVDDGAQDRAPRITTQTIRRILPMTLSTTQCSASRIARRTRGQTHVPVTRLMSPSDFGQLLKPFVFLDLFDNHGKPFSGFGLHPLPVSRPSPMKAGERWRYQPPAEHTVLWTAIGMGSVLVPDELRQGELVAFNPSNAAIEFEVLSDSEFVLGSAVPHRYDLVLGSHSVHTTVEALREAEARIATIEARLHREGRL